MKTPEGRVKDDVRKYLTSIGAYWFMPVQTGYGRPTLDFLVCWRGLFIAIETKAPGKNLTKRQQALVKSIWKKGGMAFVVHNLKELEDVFISDIALHQYHYEQLSGNTRSFLARNNVA